MGWILFVFDLFFLNRGLTVKAASRLGQKERFPFTGLMEEGGIWPLLKHSPIEFQSKLGICTLLFSINKLL